MPLQAGSAVEAACFPHTTFKQEGDREMILSRTSAPHTREYRVRRAPTELNNRAAGLDRGSAKCPSLASSF